MRFESGRLTTTKQVLERMMEVMGIPKEQEEESSDINVEPNQPPFSLWLTSKFLRKYIILGGGGGGGGVQISPYVHYLRG